jgi:hypothetical protein
MCSPSALLGILYPAVIAAILVDIGIGMAPGRRPHGVETLYDSQCDVHIFSIMS